MPASSSDNTEKPDFWRIARELQELAKKRHYHEKHSPAFTKRFNTFLERSQPPERDDDDRGPDAPAPYQPRVVGGARCPDDSDRVTP